MRHLVRELGEGVRDADGARGKVAPLKHTHRTIPQHSFCIRQRALERLQRVRPNVEALHKQRTLGARSYVG